MPSQKEIAEDIPHEYRVKILTEWLPNSKPVSLANPNFKMLFEAYFIYIDPAAVRKDDCQKCIMNVHQNWKDLRPTLIEIEKEYNLLAGL